jgi:hypothetical protein
MTHHDERHGKGRSSDAEPDRVKGGAAEAPAEDATGEAACNVEPDATRDRHIPRGADEVSSGGTEEVSR